MKAIIADDQNKEFDEHHYHPELKAGMRFPHYFVKVDGKTISTLDLFQHHFVLFTLDTQSAHSQHLPNIYPCRHYVIGQNIVDVDGRFEQLFRDTRVQGVSVRPDGHVYELI